MPNDTSPQLSSPTSTALLAPPKPGPLANVRRARRAQLTNQITAWAPFVGIGAGALLVLDRRTRAVGVSVLGASVGLGLVRWQLQRFVTEEAPYEVWARAGALEIRRYAPTVLAETVVELATWDEALELGFHRLAGYIFGGNDAMTDIPMTTPVVGTLPQTPHEAVSASASSVERDGSDAADRTITFVMPGTHTLATLPAPFDTRIQLREQPARLVAALRFRGPYGGTLPARKKEELVAKVRDEGLTPAGEVFFAGYDPPSTLPFLRRNEVMVEVR